MAATTTKFKDLEAQNDETYSDGMPLVGSSTAPPPPFDDESSTTILPPFTDLVFPPGPGESDPPPVFAPYEAEFFLVGYDDIVSHDPHLNTDGAPLPIPTPPPNSHHSPAQVKPSTASYYHNQPNTQPTASTAREPTQKQTHTGCHIATTTADPANLASKPRHKP